MQVELKYNIVKLVGGEWDFGETLSKADKTFSKSERFPSARGAWTGNLSPFTKDLVSLWMRSPKISFSTNQLYYVILELYLPCPFRITIDYLNSNSCLAVFW